MVHHPGRSRRPAPSDRPSLAPGLPLRVDPARAEDRVRTVRLLFAQSSRHLPPGDVLGAKPADLARLFKLYDHVVFEGQLTRRLRELGCGIPSFAFSQRLKVSTGRTLRIDRGFPAAPDAVPPRGFHLEISEFLVVFALDIEDRDVRVCGLECWDRLGILLRAFEHELVHLVELMTWVDSDCSTPAFRSMASRLFGHTASGHDLSTPQELDARSFGLCRGDRVAFEHEGVRLVGVIDRIRRRAAVRVRQPGAPGRPPKFRTYLVPVDLLTRL